MPKFQSTQADGLPSGQVTEWTGGRVDGWTGGRVDGWTGGRVDGFADFSNKNKELEQKRLYFNLNSIFHFNRPCVPAADAS